MRSPIRKELIEQFVAELERRLPNFKRVKRSKPGMDPKWVWKLAPDLTFFIKLQPLRRRDHFVLEVGWTDRGDIGVRDNYQSSVDPSARKWGARLSQIWDRPKTGVREPAWEIVTEPSDEQKQERVRAFNLGEVPSVSFPDPPVEAVMPRISSQKRDAVDAIEQYAMPVFRRVAEARGIAWPWEGLKPSRRARDVQCVGAVKGDGAPTAPNPSADSNDGTTSRS